MTTCCEITSDISDRQRRVLGVVLGLNAAMFEQDSLKTLAADQAARRSGD